MDLGRFLTALGSIGLLAVSAGCASTLPPAPSAPVRDVGPSAFRLDSLELRFLLDRAVASPTPIAVIPPDGGVGRRLGVIAAGESEARFLVARRDLAHDGGLTLEVGAAGAVPLPGWAHLLALAADPAAAAAVPTETRALRSRSLAYTRLSALDDDGMVRLGLGSHSLEATVGESGALTTLRLDGESLPGVHGATVIGGVLALQRRTEEGGRTTVEWLHEGANPLRLTMERMGDRIRYSYEYQVVKSFDRSVPVATRFSLPGGFAALESLTWRRFVGKRSNRPPQFRADPDPGDAPIPFSQYPFLAARGANGAYIGVLDQEASSLFGRVNEANNSFDVEMWLWPRTVGQTYHWSFDVLAGYEQYANAFLRAFEPYTIANRSDFSGGMHGQIGILDSVEGARQAYANGVRAVYIHAWFIRNGLYFLADQPTSQQYTGMWGETYSYDRTRQQVRNGQAAGLKVYVYFQFAGISEDVASQFAPSLVVTGDTTVAGHDGGIHGAPWINNLWVNPDPDGVYGRSFLEQLDGMLAFMQPDGIHLDRTDRLDFAYDHGYDYGAFDGYASPRLPGAQSKPASSITHQGVKMLHRVREVLDRHDAELWSNLPTVIPAFAVSDIAMIDQPMTPWSMFFMRAGSNGKPLMIMERANHMQLSVEEKCRDNKLIAWLSRAHPTLSKNAETADLCPEPLAERYANPRLQYVIPTDDGYPAYWLFEDGTSILRHDEAPKLVTERFEGSTFIPLDQATD